MSDDDECELRVLVLAPTSKDADLAQSILGRAGVKCVCCDSLIALCRESDAGAGAVLLPEEAVITEDESCLIQRLWHQPLWSDLPVLVLARPGADSAAVAQAMELLGNVTVLERPMRVAALVSAVRAALRARKRQYETREHLSLIERGERGQALLAAIVSSSEDAIISKTLDGVILSWNHGAERLFGYSADEIIGQPVLVLIPPERHAEEPSILDRVRRGEPIEHFETVRVTKDGRRLDISLTVSPVRDAAGKIIAASKIARDISPAKRAAEALRDADRRKDEFLATLAHELRNPLAPIRNSLHILRMTSQRDPAVESVSEMIERQVNHMIRLVDDLMEVSRITRGKIELRQEPVELAAIVRNALETSRPLIDSARQQVAVTVPSEPITLNADAVRLTQVVANLLNNASKYTDAEGQIWLIAGREKEYVEIRVRDTGMGIPPDRLPEVFELFTQIDRRADRAQSGLGIGLTLARRLVELHGGTITAHSEGLGHGSEFVVRLPIHFGQFATGALTSHPRLSPVLAQRRVLVVDDNRDAADSLTMLLRLLGAEVYTAYSGDEALQIIPTFQPAVALLDIGMPGMDGHEVARRIRQLPDCGPVTLIALSGWGQDADYRRSQSAGFHHHLIKPADLGSLETLLRSVGSDDPLTRGYISTVDQSPADIRRL